MRGRLGGLGHRLLMLDLFESILWERGAGDIACIFIVVASSCSGMTSRIDLLDSIIFLL